MTTCSGTTTTSSARATSGSIDVESVTRATRRGMPGDYRLALRLTSPHFSPGAGRSADDDVDDARRLDDHLADGTLPDGTLHVPVGQRQRLQLGLRHRW